MIGYNEFIKSIFDSTMIFEEGSTRPLGFTIVYLHYQDYLVNIKKAEMHRQDLIDWMKSYSMVESCFVNRGWKFFQRSLGDRDTTLRFFAMGVVIGLWNIITPKLIGLSGEEADKAADEGYIAINVFDPAGKPSVLLGIAKRNETARRKSNAEFVLTNTGTVSDGFCFICNQHKSNLSVIKCWVYSEASAKRIVEMVGPSAKYIYFPSDPKRTHTVEISFCVEDHKKFLYLKEAINLCGCISFEMLNTAKSCIL